MQLSVPFSPDQASSYAGRVDSLYAFLCVLTIMLGGLIAVVITYFAVKYRRRSENEIPLAVEGSMRLEIAWTVIPFIISMGIFFWGASLYYAMYRAPNDAA